MSQGRGRTAKGAMARTFGAYRQQEDVWERVLFVLDSVGRIRWSYVSPIGVSPAAAGVLRPSKPSLPTLEVRA